MKPQKLSRLSRVSIYLQMNVNTYTFKGDHSLSIFHPYQKELYIYSQETTAPQTLNNGQAIRSEREAPYEKE